MDKNKIIDNLFREKLGNYKPEYIHEHWQLMKPVIKNSGITNYGNPGYKITDIIVIIVTILVITSGIVTNVFSKNTRQSNIKEQQISLYTAMEFNNLEKIINIKIRQVQTIALKSKNQ